MTTRLPNFGPNAMTLHANACSNQADNFMASCEADVFAAAVAINRWAQIVLLASPDKGLSMPSVVKATTAKK